MATIRDAVTRGLQWAGVVALGRDPRAAEAGVGLEAVQSLLDQWMQDGMFGCLVDVYKTANYTASEYERVTSPSSITVTKPTYIDNERRSPFELAPIVTVLNGVQTNYVFTQGAWLNLTGLTLDSDLPLEHYGRRGFEAMVGVKLCETFGLEPRPVMANEALRFQGRIMSKGGQDREVAEPSDYQ